MNHRVLIIITAGVLSILGLLQLTGCDRQEQNLTAAQELAPPIQPAAKAGDAWGSVKGQIVWAGDKIPEPKDLNVDKDKDHCLAKGPIKDEDLVVNAKNRGMRWVFVWLAPLEDGKEFAIHPSLKEIKEKQVVLDQPQCMFIPRAFAIREGQEILTKNPAPVMHNVRWIGHPDFNEGGNQTIPPGKEYVIKGLKAQKYPLHIECNVHPWMRSRLAVFTHPYFAVTDADGTFEIKNAPAGKCRLFIWQESIGWRGGAAGRNGEEITIPDNGTLDLRQRDMKKD